MNDDRAWLGRPRVPLLEWLPRYQRGDWPADLLAGAVVTALAVPQALGYAGLAGVPVQVGLYALPLALVAYAVLGSSRQLFVGPVSTVSVMSGSVVAGMALGDPARAVALTAALALACGLVLLVAGLLRLGWSAEFLSKPIVTGFVFGLVVVIIIGEVPHLLGVPTPPGNALGRVVGLVRELGAIDATTVAVSTAALGVLFLGARFAPRVPWGLLVLLGGIAASQALDLAGRGVEVVGVVPQGLPPLAVPQVGWGDLAPLLTGGAALAMVGLAEGLSAARLFAGQQGGRIDADQELVATGAANVAAGFSGGMGVAGSLSKTAAVVRAGGRTQMTSLVAAVLVIAVALVLAPQLAALPRAVLSAIVVQAVWGLMDVASLRRYAEVRRNDAVSAGLALAGVVLLGPLYGLLLAVAQSVLGLVYRSSRAPVDVMGKVPGEKAAWGSVAHHPDRRTTDGVLVLRLDGPLFWVNAEQVCDAVLEAVEQHPGTHSLVLDLEATGQLDTTSVDALTGLLTDLRARGVDLYLVRVLRRAREVLQRSGFEELLGPEHRWHSISQGVRTAKAHHKAAIGQAADGDGGEDRVDDLVDDEALLLDEPDDLDGHVDEHIAADHDPNGNGEGPDAGEHWWPLPTQRLRRRRRDEPEPVQQGVNRRG